MFLNAMFTDLFRLNVGETGVSIVTLLNVMFSERKVVTPLFALMCTLSKVTFLTLRSAVPPITIAPFAPSQ